LQPSDEEIRQLPDTDDTDFVSIVEKRHRHTWKVNSSSYYKFFRFVGLTKEQLEAVYDIEELDDNRLRLGPDDRILFSDCLHGVGFELYGDVKSALHEKDKE